MDALWDDNPFGGIGPPSANVIYPAPLAWDRQHEHQFLRILTLNMHGRPMDAATAWSGDGGDATHLDCDDEWTLSNAQDRRMRGFFQWLDRLPPSVVPHVICLQEIMWDPMIEIAKQGFAERGYSTLRSISLDVDRGNRATFPPRMGSGLAIYVREAAQLHVVLGGAEVFAHRLGADTLVDKGFKWALVRSRNTALNPAGVKEGYFVVLTCHPQAYNQLYTEAAPGESFVIALMRKIVRLGFDLKGGFPAAVTRAHKHQYGQMAAAIRDTILPRALSVAARAQGPNSENGGDVAGEPNLIGFFVAADLNVNRYATAPESAAESDVRAAQTGQMSREFAAVLQTLGAAAPVLKREDAVPALIPPHGGRFTWDSYTNSVAKPVVPGSPSGYAWIDSILALRLPQVNRVRHIDNRALAVRLPVPVPELSPFWSSPCRRWREQHREERRSYAGINQETEDRLRLGYRQQRELLRRFRQSAQGRGASSRAAWHDFVWRAPFALSSQLWKGFDYYGIRLSDVHALKETQFLRIGSPHPFRMLTDVSDHHAVIARILL